jgi:plastocyanin
MWGLLNLSSTTPGLVLSENTTNTPGFLPDTLSATPGHYPIVIAVLVTNEGTLGHTFTLVPQSNVSLSPTGSNVTDYFAAHAPLVNANIPALTGGSGWANFTISHPGIYEYICEISGHFAAGMFGYLYVGIPVPPPPPAPSTAIVDGWVLAGSGILLGIGVIFVGAAALSGRFPPRKSEPGHHP